MPQSHNQIAPHQLHEVNLAPHSRVKLRALQEFQSRHCNRRRARRRLGSRDSYDADFMLTFFDDYGRPRKQLSRCLDHDVAGEHRESSLTHSLQSNVLPVVELVIAEAHRVIADRVHELHRRGSLAEIHQIVVLNGIACIQNDHIFPLRRKLIAKLGHGRHSVHAVLSGALIVAVRVIGMQNDEIGKIGSEGRTGHQADHQEQAAK